MKANGIRGAKRRGRAWRTTTPDPAAHRRPDLVERNFTASQPNELWVADLTYLRSWDGLSFLAFVVDVFSRKVVGWQLAPHMRTDLVLDALRMALGTRGPGADVELVHHSDRGSQGEFKWSSQHLSERSCDGKAKSGVGSSRAARDAIGRTSVGRPARAPAAVLGRDRSWCVERGRRDRGGRFAGGRRPVVSRGWRDAARRPRSAVGAVPVVHRAGGDRDPTRPGTWGPGDCASARSLTIDGFAGAAPQRRDPQRRL